MTVQRGLSISRTACATGLLLWVVLLHACSTPKDAPNAVQQRVTQQAQLGARAVARADYALARVLYEQALAGAESIEDFPATATLLINLAWLHSRLGNNAEALAKLDRIESSPLRFGPLMVARAATRRALLLIDLSRVQEAEQSADRASSACANPCELSATLANVRAQIALQRGQVSVGLQHAQWGLDEALRTTQLAEELNAWRWLGRAHSLSGQTALAADELTRALGLAQRLGLPERVAAVLTEAGDNQSRASRADLAREYFERALNVFLALGDKQGTEHLRKRLGQ